MIKIGKVVSSYLLSSTELTDIIGDKIYPIFKKDNGEYPILVYVRESRLDDSTKDLDDSEEQMTITIGDNSYARSVDVADIVETLLKSSRGYVFDGIEITSCDIVDTPEFEEEDIYVQQVTFNIGSRKI